MVWKTLIMAGCFSALVAGCGRETPKGAAEHNTIFGDVPEYGQTPGEGRIDSGGGILGPGVRPDSPTNYTEPGLGIPRSPAPEEVDNMQQQQQQ
jgi:hypothetical protein